MVRGNVDNNCLKISLLREKSGAKTLDKERSICRGKMCISFFGKLTCYSLLFRIIWGVWGIFCNTQGSLQALDNMLVRGSNLS